MNEPINIIQCPPPASKNFKDLSGRKFGRLSVICYVGKRTYGDGSIIGFWKCECDCGKFLIVGGANMKSGNTVSCGCFNRENISNRYAIHRKSRTPAYGRWSNMLDRCENPKRAEFINYGGRGVTVCDRWHNFENFLLDMGQPPEGLTLERIDNNGNYEPSNCKWATFFDQAKNRRTTRFIECFGLRKCVREWERHLGFKNGAIAARIARGWSEERAIKTPWMDKRKNWSLRKRIENKWR